MELDPDPNVPMLLKFDGLALRSMATKDRKCVPNLNKVSSLDRTVITIADSQTWTSIRGQGAGSIAKHLYVFDFQTIDLTPPFSASVAGIVASVEQGTESAGGVPMKAFTLSDQRGRQLACLAFGRHSDNPQLVNGHEVAIFFGTAQADRNGGRGTLWLFDDSHIVVLRVACKVPQLTALIELRS